MRSSLFIVILFTGLLSSMNCSAQQNHTLGILPSISLSTTIGERLKMITGIESRQRFLDTRNEPSSQYEYLLTDFSNFIRFKSSAYSSIAFGYTIRQEGDMWIHRISQQYNLTHGLNKGRVSHRIATDQTWEQSTFILRGRYRIVHERPLIGEQIDPQELYLKLGQESLFILEEGDVSLELRILPRMGLEIKKRSKIEWGLDYRLKDPFASKRRNDLYLTFSFYTTLER